MATSVSRNPCGRLHVLIFVRYRVETARFCHLVHETGGTLAKWQMLPPIGPQRIPNHREHFRVLQRRAVHPPMCHWHIHRPHATRAIHQIRTRVALLGTLICPILCGQIHVHCTCVFGFLRHSRRTSRELGLESGPNM